MSENTVKTRDFDYDGVLMTEYQHEVRKGTSSTKLEITYGTQAVPNRFKTKQEAYEAYKNKYPDA